MSPAELSFREGRLADCLQALQAEVRSASADPKKRIFLAQLLMILGQWDRALTQLNVIRELDAGALPMVTAYQSAIECELLRAQVFTGVRSPLIFGDPEPWIAALLSALSLEGAGRLAEAAAVRARALDEAPPSAGSVNGDAFSWIADADTRLGPVLEVLLNGAYYWVPVHRIKSVSIEKPTDARDLVWLPAQFTWTNEGQAMGFIPSRYPGSESGPDDAIRLGRRTDWQPVAEGVDHGLGQRLLATDQGEYGLLEVREIILDVAS
jgi:type VI secretion system protein ImpE